jgi:hypothetical protein
MHGSHNRNLAMFVGSPHGIDRVVHETFDGLNDFVCSAVTIPRKVQRTSAESEDERADIWIVVHDFDVLSELIFGNDRMYRIHSIDVVWNKVKEISFGVLRCK